MKTTKTIVLSLLLTSTAFAGTAFLKSERISGLNKVCVYDSPSGDVAITIKAHELCPLTITV